MSELLMKDISNHLPVFMIYACDDRKDKNDKIKYMSLRMK